MAGINLLPQDQRTQTGTQRNLVFPMLALMLFSTFAGVHLRLDGIVKAQEVRKAELTTGIARLEPVRVQRELLAGLEKELADVVRELDRRVVWSEYVEELARCLPPGVVVRDARLEGTNILAALSAESLGQVARFITSVRSSELFEEPAVGQITVGSTNIEFQATIKIITSR